MRNYIQYLKYNLEMQKRQFWFFVETTSFCNARCEFCINPRLKREKCHMPDEVFNTILRRIKDERITPTGFCMHLNGEPLLDPLIVQRINKVGEAFPNVTIEMTTNFALADDALISDLINSKLGTLRISVNAADEESYNKRMHLKNLQNTLDNVYRVIELNENACKKKKIILTVVENENNRNQIEELRREITKEGEYELRTIKEGSSERTSAAGCLEGKRIICDALYKTVCILSNGNYSMCCYDAEGMVGANIQDTPILVALRSDFYRKLRRDHLKKPINQTICSGCSRYLDWM